MVLSEWLPLAIVVLAGSGGLHACPADDRAASVGVWAVEAVEVNGKQVDPETSALLRVSYRADGSWAVHFNGLPVGEGTSRHDPEARPRTFDMQTLGGTKTPARTYVGIYMMEDDIRRLCFVSADMDRPDAFTSPRGSGRILVVLRRIKDREPR